ncbi:MAG: AMP-binding protein [Acetobacteraceae bacterium]
MENDAAKAVPTGAPTWIARRPVAVDLGGPVDVPFEPFLAEWIDEPVIVRFRAVAQRHADKLAIDDGDTHLTYSQVQAAVDALAARLNNATPLGSAVAALLDNTTAFPIAFLACLASGRTIVPVDISYPPDRQEAILRECGAAAFIVGPGIEPPASLADTLVRLTVPLQGDSGSPPPDTAVDVDAPAGVIYTSGSTGQPKGVAFSQRQFLAALAEYINACHIGPHDRIVGLASLGGGSAREALAALLTGATFHIADLRQHGIGPALRKLRMAEVTVLAFVPSVLRSLCGVPGIDAALASLRIVDLFGELVTAETVDALRAVLPATCHIRVSLGSTETMVLFHWFVPRGVQAGNGLPCGYLASRASIALLDEYGAPVPEGEVGEVVVRGRSIASGMWRDGAVLPGPFQPDPADPQARIFHTGDLVRMDKDGLVTFVGRRDRRVKIRGLRADPADVETALHRIPGVADCAVITRVDGDEVAFVAYVESGGVDLAGGAIRDALRLELPAHMMPADIHVISRLPRLPNFKPDLVALAQGAAAPH